MSRPRGSSDYTALFFPQTIAVVGASTTGAGRQNAFIRRLRRLGYAGEIYPIHPRATEIEGLPAFRSLADTPRPVDYAQIAIPAAQIPEVCAAAQGRVRFAQVISSGFGEVAEGRELERALLAAVRTGGMRLLGPNCLGIYSPRAGLAFTEMDPLPPGGVGIVSQSGGLAVDIIRRGANKGLRFSGVVTVGNCADIGNADLLEFYLADPSTRVIGLYIETAKDARRLFDVLREARGSKPVVLLKGGRTDDGRAAAASHTGSLAGNGTAWTALSRQTGCLLVRTLDEFLDTLLLLQASSPNAGRPTLDVALFGNGGGTSVLATDYYAELGLRVRRFGPATLDALSALALPAGSSIANPVDCPAGNLKRDGTIVARVLDALYRHGDVQAIVLHVNMATSISAEGLSALNALVKSALDVQAAHPRRAHFLLVLRSDGSARLDGLRQELRVHATSLGVPVYDELADAGVALAALGRYERFLHTRGYARETDH